MSGMIELINFSWVILLLAIVLISIIPSKSKPYAAAFAVLLGSLASGYMAVSALSGQVVDLSFYAGFFLGDVSIHIDGLSAWFILIINFTSLTGAFYGTGYLKDYQNDASKLTIHWSLFVLFYFSMVWVCMLQNGFAFLIAWEIMSLSSMFLVIFDHHSTQTLKAGINYLVQMHISVVLLTVGFIWVYSKTGSLDFDAIGTFFQGNPNLGLFLVFFAGFGLKAGLVMTQTSHVLLMGEGAELFAKEQGLELMDPSYFQTPARTEQYERMRKYLEEKELQNNEINRDKSKVIIRDKKQEAPDTVKMVDDKTKGTVGAVALDNMGNLAAATSTGGLMMKMKGRIGDTPIIGAGTYANNATCAVSCTGTGEYFMRNVIAYDVSALMEYRGFSLEEAANYLIREKLKSQGGGGGLIAIDKEGNIAMPFNTNAMFRGYAKAREGAVVEIY